MYLIKLSNVLLFFVISAYVSVLYGINHGFQNIQFLTLSWLYFASLIFIFLKIIKIEKGNLLQKNNIPLFLIFSFILAASLAYPYLWDDVFYNSYFLKEYLNNNNFDYLNNYGFYSAFPLYTDSLNIILFNIFGYIGPKINLLVYIPLLLILLNYVFEKLNIEKNLKIFGYLIIFSSPAVLEYLPTAKTDFLVNILIFLSFIILILIKSNFYQKYIYSVLIFSSAVGFKYSALYFLPIYSLLLLFLVYQETKSFSKVIKICLLGAGLFFIVNLPWLYRNFSEIGNPVYPILSGFMPWNESIIFSDLKKSLLTEMISSSDSLNFHQFDSFVNFYYIFTKKTYFFLLYIPILIFTLLKLKKIKIQFSVKEKKFNLLTAAFMMQFIFFMSWELRHVIFILFFLTITNLIMINKLISHVNFLKIKYFLWIYIFLISLLTTKACLYITKKYHKQFNCTFIENCLFEKNQYLRSVDYVNKNLNKYDKVASNSLPYYYLNNKFINIQPWSDDEQIKVNDNLSFYNYLVSNDVNYLIWTFWDSSKAYDASKGKNIILYYKNINNSVIYLENNNYISPIFNTSETKIFKINYEKK